MFYGKRWFDEITSAASLLFLVLIFSVIRGPGPLSGHQPGLCSEISEETRKMWKDIRFGAGRAETGDSWQKKSRVPVPPESNSSAPDKMDTISPSPRDEETPGSEFGVTSGTTSRKANSLALSDAIGLALARNSVLLKAKWDLMAARAEVALAGISPSPEFGIELEKFGGKGAFNGFDSAEATLSFSRPIEGSGKRTARIALAEAAESSVESERRALESEVRLRTATAFYETLAEQELLTIKVEDHATAGQILDAIRRRVQAGKVSPVEEARARVLMATSAMELGRARGRLKAARKALASNWGERDFAHETLAGKLSSIPDVPDFLTIEHGLERHPALGVLASKVEEARAAMRLAGTSGTGDMSVSAGISRSAGDDVTTFKAGLDAEFGSPALRDDEVKKADAALEKARLTLEAGRLELLSRLDRLQVDMETAAEAVKAFDREILPSAALAHNAARRGYEEGTTGYLEVLDTRRTLAEARSQFVQALLDYHRIHLFIEAISGDREFDAEPAHPAEPTKSASSKPEKRK